MASSCRRRPQCRGRAGCRWGSCRRDPWRPLRSWDLGGFRVSRTGESAMRRFHQVLNCLKHFENHWIQYVPGFYSLLGWKGTREAGDDPECLSHVWGLNHQRVSADEFVWYGTSNSKGLKFHFPIHSHTFPIQNEVLIPLNTEQLHVWWQQVKAAVDGATTDAPPHRYLGLVIGSIPKSTHLVAETPPLWLPGCLDSLETYVNQESTSPHRQVPCTAYVH